MKLKTQTVASCFAFLTTRTQYCDKNIMIFDNLWQQVSIDQPRYALNITQYKVCRCFVKSMPWLVIANLKLMTQHYQILSLKMPSVTRAYISVIPNSGVEG